MRDTGEAKRMLIQEIKGGGRGGFSCIDCIGGIDGSMMAPARGKE